MSRQLVFSLAPAVRACDTSCDKQNKYDKALHGGLSANVTAVLAIIMER